MKIFRSVFAKILLSILFTTLVVVSTIGYITSVRINRDFDQFITRQEREIYGYGPQFGKNLSPEEKKTRHKLLLDDFRQTVNTSIIVASFIGFIIALITGAILSSKISTPLNQLRLRVRKARKNQFEKVEISTSIDEIKDLTVEFNQLIDELNRVEHLREELVADVAHELKTPLTNIKGQLEGILDGVYKCNKSKIKDILSNTDQLQYLVSQLQKHIQIRSGKIKIKKKNITLSPMIDSVFANYQNSKLRFENNIPQDTKIRADRYRLREILDNLISNAVRHTKSGFIKIYMKDTDLYIEDSGKGILKKDLPYVFERFYRVDKSRTKQTGGLGLGLAITKDLVEAHGWSIKIYSEVNKGTKVVIKGITK